MTQHLRLGGVVAEESIDGTPSIGLLLHQSGRVHRVPITTKQAFDLAKQALSAAIENARAEEQYHDRTEASGANRHL